MDTLIKLQKITKILINTMKEVADICKSQINQKQEKSKPIEPTKSSQRIKINRKTDQKDKNKQQNQKKKIKSGGVVLQRKTSKTNKSVVKNIQAPKKPTTAYLLFMNERKSKIQNENRQISGSEIIKIVTKQWKEMNSEKKNIYVSNYQKLKEKYESELTQYKKIYPQYDDKPKKKTKTHQKPKQIKTIEISSSQQKPQISRKNSKN